MVHAKSVHTDSEDEVDDLVAQVVEEYFQRLKRGERPQLEEFVEKYPTISDLLRTVIPGLQTAEQFPDVSAGGKVSHERHKQLGDFRLLRQIGRGGMGIVYEAEQISMNRRVALKVLPLAGLVDELKIRRFQNEVRAVAALDHPNIVSVHMVGEERGVHYYAMQLIRGRSLSEVISSLRHIRDEGQDFDGSSISQITNRGIVDDRAEADPDATMPRDVVRADPDGEAGAETTGTFSKAESSTIPHSSRREYFRSVATLGVQAASALQHAHDAGIIHRDIKPANLLLDSASKLFVTDFGLARIEADAGVTMTGDLVGTLRYMAPEQALAKRVVVDQRADIYSLAATLYELLTLRPAYLAEDRQQLLKQIAFEEPVPLRRIDRDIPAELETIVHKAMSKDMDQRYASAQALADDLRSHLENRPIKAKPPTTSEIIGKWTRRNPTLTWSAMITLSLVTMTLVVSTLFIARQRDLAWQIAESRRQELYASQINLAHQTWSDGDLEQAQILLESLRPAPDRPEQPDLRGFEWYYLWKLCQDESATLVLLTGDDGKTFDETLFSDRRKLSFSADGGKLAVADRRVVRIWDFDGRRELTPVAPHAKSVSALAFSPTNFGLLATADEDETIKLWDLTTGTSPHILAKDTSSNYLAFSPNGDRLASATSDGWVKLWDVETKKEIRSIEAHWDAEGGKAEGGEGKARPALCVSFSPDGEYVASGGGDTTVKLWNAATGEQVGPDLAKHTAFVFSLDFSPDGRQLATCGLDGRIFLWDLTTVGGADPLPLLGHKGGVMRVAFAPDGETLASGGEDRTIRLWSVASTRQISILRGHLGGVHSLAFSPDGQSLVSANGESVKIWDALAHRRKDILTEHAGWVEALALSPDGRTLVTSDFHSQALNLWDVPSRSFLGPLRGHTDFPTCMAISPDGKLLASGGSDKTVRLWDLSNHEPIKTHRCDYAIREVGFSSDGTVLRAAGRGTLKFWDVETHQVEPIRGELGDLVSSSTAFTVAFSPRGALLTTTTDDGRVVVWDANDGRKVTSFKGEAAETSSVAFSWDGHLIALGGREDGSITLFDVSKPESLQRLQGHTSEAFHMAFTPDSRTLASAGWDGTAKIWNIASGKVALTLQHTGPATDVAFSNDGSLMATCGADGTARLWFAASLSEADEPSRTR